MFSKETHNERGDERKKRKQRAKRGKERGRKIYDVYTSSVKANS